jgi:hypothetical protein
VVWLSRKKHVGRHEQVAEKRQTPLESALIESVALRVLAIFKAIENDSLCRGDFGRLRFVQLTLPAEHFGLEVAAMIERLNVESVVISSWHYTRLLSSR